MSAFEIIIELAGLMLLSGCLYVMHRRRVHGQPRQNPAEWTGSTIDLTKLKPTLEDVRRDYLAARCPPHGNFFHRSFLAHTRRVVMRLAYFRGRESEGDAKGP
jgi:hypothetical protein